MNNRMQLLKLIMLFLGGIMPIPVVGYILHTPKTLIIAFFSFLFIGLLMPFFWYLVQKEEYDGLSKKLKAIVHIVLWLGFMPVISAYIWYYLPWISLGGTFLTIGIVLGMALHIIFITWLVHLISRWYQWIRDTQSPFIKLWSSCCFLIGFIPGMAIISLFSLYIMGGTHLDPLTGAYILMVNMWYVLYIKIFIAMITIAVYVFFALTGTKGYRAIRVIFTALFWLTFMFIPMVVSIRIPWEGGWRTYFDPSYLAMFPFLSDLWVNVLSLWGSKKVTNWIFSIT